MPVRIISAAMLAGAGLLSACVAVAPPPPAVDGPHALPTADACNSAAYQRYVGQRSPMISLPPGTTMRDYRSGDPVTLDYNPERINFEYSRTGVLVSVTCG